MTIKIDPGKAESISNINSALLCTGMIPIPAHVSGPFMLPRRQIAILPFPSLAAKTVVPIDVLAFWAS
ncbi:hypothetical protein EUGRSUZ_H05135 [Eucalyptus grandis]|uniref:Uncharacterized protein n=2 Tax=Eucalyptus grandis TaxID=71139 RepID=A0ACC3JYI4_EUCGR|nr:hypothetical protein EUGRSUZ_H05135 [Eucalyptus grandis]